MVNGLKTENRFTLKRRNAALICENTKMRTAVSKVAPKNKDTISNVS